MVKCPYCGAGPEKFEAQLKAYVPVVIRENGTIELELFTTAMERQIADSILDCFDRESQDCQCCSCGNYLELKEIDCQDSIMTLKKVGKFND